MPSCSAILPCHSYCNDLILLSLFGLAVYSFLNGLTRPWAFFPMGSCVPFSHGHPWPICLPWVSSAPFTNFVFSWAFTDFIGLPRLNYFILILGVYGLAINPLLSLLALFRACRGLFLLFFPHHTLPMGLLLTISLFPDSFEPICFLKAHLLISWTCDLLFLPLGLNGLFCSLSLANFSVLLSWASFLTFGFHKKKTLNNMHDVNCCNKYH